jgi:hypothetical protein
MSCSSTSSLCSLNVDVTNMWEALARAGHMLADSVGHMLAASAGALARVGHMVAASVGHVLAASVGHMLAAIAVKTHLYTYV